MTSEMWACLREAVHDIHHDVIILARMLCDLLARIEEQHLQRKATLSYSSSCKRITSEQGPTTFSS